MEQNFPHSQRFEVPAAVLKELYNKEVPKCSASSFTEDHSSESPPPFKVDLSETITSLQSLESPTAVQREVCNIPVLLFVSDFSTDHLLFHYDGTSNSTELIQNFITLFSNLIQDSKATIISPSFIPKSKIREEQQIIKLVVSATKETSFIKLNFANIEDFCAYGIDHNCTLLVTAKDYHTDLSKILFRYRKGKIGERIFVVLPLAPANLEKVKCP